MPGEFDAEFDSAPDAAALNAEFDAAPEVGANMSVGQPAPVIPNKGLWGQTKDLMGKAVDVGQEFSTGMMRGMLGAPAEPTIPSVLGRAITPDLSPVLSPGQQLTAARGYAALNPFVSGPVGDKVFETPKAQELYKENRRTGIKGRVLGGMPAAQAEKEMDASELLTQGMVGPIAAASPFQAGVSVSAQVAPKIPYFGTAFPKLAAFITGATEAGVTMPVMGALGAEKGERESTLVGLLTNPDPVALSFMALGGTGAALQRGRQARGERSSGVKSLGDEYKGGQTERQFVDFMQKKGQAPETKFAGREFSAIPKTEGSALDAAPPPVGQNVGKVRAVIGPAEMTQMADELEQRVAAEGGGTVPPQVEDWNVGGAKLTKTQRQKDRRAGVLPSNLLKEVPAQVAIVESPTSDWGVRAVIEWVPTKKSTFLAKTGK